MGFLFSCRATNLFLQPFALQRGQEFIKICNSYEAKAGKSSKISLQQNVTEGVKMMCKSHFMRELQYCNVILTHKDLSEAWSNKFHSLHLMQRKLAKLWQISIVFKKISPSWSLKRLEKLLLAIMIGLQPTMINQIY